jgi:beta-glucanase (GH16 family)
LISCEDTSTPEKSWTLVWEDNFDGGAGSLPDATKWTFDIGTGWGNQQLEYDTDRAENVSLEGNGNLLIVAREESYQGSDYTSGRIITRGLFEVMHGRVEARMKLPWGQGLWSAFWLLGANIDEVSWPQCGEIDIMEYRGQEQSRIHGSVHGPDYSAGDAVTKKFDLYNDRFDTDFHIFAVEWDSEEIRFYVDNQIYFTILPEDIPGEWVFDNNFNIILNLAVGGTYVSPPNEYTVFPQTMTVDYVRVYK